MLYFVQLVSLEEGRRIFQASSSVPRKSNEKILDLSSLFFPSARGGGIIQIKSWRLVLRRVNSLIWMDGQLADFSAVWNSNRFFYFSFRGLFLEPMRSRARPRGRLLSSHGITSRQIKCTVCSYVYALESDILLVAFIGRYILAVSTIECICFKPLLKALSAPLWVQAFTNNHIRGSKPFGEKAYWRRHSGNVKNRNESTSIELPSSRNVSLIYFPGSHSSPSVFPPRLYTLKVRRKTKI